MLYRDALRRLPYEPMPQQASVLQSLCVFVVNSGGRDVMVVRGYAGTGKTSLTAAFVGAMRAARYKCVLMAPTGRAAKVFSGYAGVAASTIHKRLFRGDALNADAGATFFLAENRERDTLFVVDEASMIPAKPAPGLLQCLVRYVYSGDGCRLLLIGDGAQLPPVGQEVSPAMHPEVLRKLALNPTVVELDSVARQAAKSGILFNATLIRRAMMRKPLELPPLRVAGFGDVRTVTSEDVVDAVTSSYSQVGEDSTIVITRSNFRASAFNRGIRGQVLYAEDVLQRGERLVVVKNNYYWGKNVAGLGFVANGEIVRVDHFGRTEHRYGFRFCDAELYVPSSGVRFDAKIMINTLLNDDPVLAPDRLRELYDAVLQEKIEDGDDPVKASFAMRSDPYFNALQVKYAYCLTCHKAQGGQWEHVYIDLGGIKAEGQQLDFYRWLYTAVTRATRKLFLINSSLPVR